jgi:hypothetical protein
MSKVKKAYYLLLASQLIDLIFTLVEWDTETKYYFYPKVLFHGWGTWDGSMLLSEYVYHYCQHVSIMCILYAAFMAPGEGVFRVCFVLEAMDMADFGIHFNHTLFSIGDWGIEFNLFKFVLLLLYVLPRIDKEETA